MVSLVEAWRESSFKGVKDQNQGDLSKVGESLLFSGEIGAQKNRRGKKAKSLLT